MSTKRQSRQSQQYETSPKYLTLMLSLKSWVLQNGWKKWLKTPILPKKVCYCLIIKRHYNWILWNTCLSWLHHLSLFNLFNRKISTKISSSEFIRAIFLNAHAIFFLLFRQWTCNKLFIIKKILLDDIELDLRMARFEHLMSRRLLLLNSVLLRQNPHNVHEWHKRVVLLEGKPAEVILFCYNSAWMKHMENFKNPDLNV